MDRQRNGVRQQFVIDILDVWIPATNLGLVNFNDGVLGIFGYVILLKRQADSKQRNVGLSRPCWLCVNSGSLSTGRSRLFIPIRLYYHLLYLPVHNALDGSYKSESRAARQGSIVMINTKKKLLYHEVFFCAAC